MWGLGMSPALAGPHPHPPAARSAAIAHTTAGPRSSDRSRDHLRQSHFGQIHVTFARIFWSRVKNGSGSGLTVPKTKTDL